MGGVDFILKQIWGTSVIFVIDKDWLACQRRLALSTPLHQYNGAILKNPKFKEIDRQIDSLMRSEIWNCHPLFFCFTGFRGHVKISWRSSTFVLWKQNVLFFVFLINVQRDFFWRHINIYSQRCGMEEEKEMWEKKDEEVLQRGTQQQQTAWTMKGWEKNQKAMGWDWTTELFSLSLELLSNQQTDKQKSSHSK